MWNVGNHDQAIEEVAEELARMPVFRFGEGLCKETVVGALVLKVLRDNNLASTEHNVRTARKLVVRFLNWGDCSPQKMVRIVLFRIMEGT